MSSLSLVCSASFAWAFVCSFACGDGSTYATGDAVILDSSAQDEDTLPLADGTEASTDARVCACNGAICGLDNCGNSCGNCAAIDYYVNGRCSPADDCGTIGFVATEQTAKVHDVDGHERLYVSATDRRVYPPWDELELELTYDDFFPAGVPMPGLFSLQDTRMPGGPLFVRGHTYCKDFECAFHFAVQSGTLELENPGDGGFFRAWLRGLKLEQVRVDAVTGNASPFPNAQLWCAGDARIDVEVPR